MNNYILGLLNSKNKSAYCARQLWQVHVFSTRIKKQNRFISFNLFIFKSCCLLLLFLYISSSKLSWIGRYDYKTSILIGSILIGYCEIDQWMQKIFPNFAAFFKICRSSSIEKNMTQSMCIVNSVRLFYFAMGETGESTNVTFFSWCIQYILIFYIALQNSNSLTIYDVSFNYCRLPFPMIHLCHFTFSYICPMFRCYHGIILFFLFVALVCVRLIIFSNYQRISFKLKIYIDKQLLVRIQ